MAATRIHHVNFIVRDLDAATAEFERLLGLEPFEIVDHATRGATVAKSKLGESWILLVCPYDADSVPGRFLERHGEGFFLLSVGTQDLEAELARLVDSGATPADRTPRDGILGWKVADVAEAYGAILHLTDDPDR